MMTRTTKKKLVMVAVSVVVVAIGVGGYVALHNRVQPEPPPRGATTTAPEFLDKESNLDVSVAIDAGWVARIAEDKLPAQLLSRSGVVVVPGVTAEVKVRRAGAIVARAQDGALHLRVPVAADIEALWRPRGWLGAPPWGGGPTLQLRPTFMIDAELKLGVDAAWNLVTATEATLRWENDPQVPIGSTQVPLSTLVGAQVGEQFAAVMRTIDERIGDEVPMRRVIGDAWSSAFGSVALDGSGERWLALRPTGLYLGDVKAQDGEVFVAAGVRGVFRVVVGERPPEVAPTPLPGLSATPTASGITLEVPVRVTFEAANRELDAQVEGQTIEVLINEGMAPARLTISEIDVYPSGTQVAVALAFSADVPGQVFDVNGHMYLLGTPHLDVGRSEIRLTGLSYDSRTNGALVDIAEWMLHGEITQFVEQRLVFPFARRIETYRDEINAVIDDYAISRAVRLRGELVELTVTALTITDDAIVALAQLRGQARFEVRSDR